MKSRTPYPSKHGNPIHEKTEDNITSINNKKEKEEEQKENLKKVIDFYENNITLITPFVSEDMEKYLQDGLQTELIIEVMKEAVSRNKRNWKYIVSILNNCLDNKILTVKQFEISQEEFRSNKTNTAKKSKTQEKIEYKEVKMTEKEYEEKMSKGGKKYV